MLHNKNTSKKEKLIKKGICAFMCASMMVGAAMPVFASETGDINYNSEYDMYHTHDYVAVQTEEAKCDEIGHILYECSHDDCGEFYIVEIPALGHDWDEGIITSDPTKDGEVEITHTCKRCGNTYTETVSTVGSEE